MPLKDPDWFVFTTLSRLFLFLLFLAAASGSAVAAGPAGEIIFAQGITSVQGPGEEPRFVAKGDAINEGETITTGSRGFAVVGLKDGAKITLRPDSALEITKFRHGAGEEAATLTILKGGVRAVTGLVAKRNPQAMQVRMKNAALKIRGTEFDARICDAKCAQEIRPTPKGKGEFESVVARVALITGSATVVGKDGRVRTAIKGTPLFSGDMLRTAKDSYAVVGFRDESKVTVVSDSEFKLEDVRFSGKQADSGNFLTRIARGGFRALTGLLAKRERKSVEFRALTATIGVRGTGLDGKIAPDCVTPTDCSPAIFVSTWQGAVAIEVGKRSLLIERGRSGVYNPAHDKLVLLDATPRVILEETAPRPDTVDIDFNNLFGVQTLTAYPPGIYVAMRDGHIEFDGPSGAIDLGAGEAGYLLDGQGIPIRLAAAPPFLSNDPYPAPENFDEQSVPLLELVNLGIGAGGVICEVQ